MRHGPYASTLIDQFAGMTVAVTDWGDFKVLLALSQGGSVAGAARILGVDSSTVSRKLAAIEEALGAVLVLRAGREFSLTPEGKTAVQAAELMQAAVASATTYILAAKQNVEGTVRVSCPGALVQSLLQMVPPLRAKYPALGIEFNADNRFVDIAKGEADIALRGAMPTSIDLIARRTVDMGWVAYASKNYIAARGQPANPDELRKHQLILYVTSLHSQPGCRWLEDFRHETDQVMRMSSTDSVTRMISLGDGIGVIPCALAEGLDVLQRVFPAPVVSSPFWLVYHESSRNTAKIRAVVDAMADYLEANSGIFTGMPKL